MIIIGIQLVYSKREWREQATLDNITKIGSDTITAGTDAISKTVSETTEAVSKYATETSTYIQDQQKSCDDARASLQTCREDAIKKDAEIKKLKDAAGSSTSLKCPDAPKCPTCPAAPKCEVCEKCPAASSSGSSSGSSSTASSSSSSTAADTKPVVDVKPEEPKVEIEKRVTDVLKLREGIMNLESGIINLLPRSISRKLIKRDGSGDTATRAQDTAYQLVSLDQHLDKVIKEATCEVNYDKDCLNDFSASCLGKNMSTEQKVKADFIKNVIEQKPGRKVIDIEQQNCQVWGFLEQLHQKGMDIKTKGSVSNCQPSLNLTNDILVQIDRNLFETNVDISKCKANK